MIKINKHKMLLLFAMAVSLLISACTGNIDSAISDTESYQYNKKIVLAENEVEYFINDETLYIKGRDEMGFLDDQMDTVETVSIYREPQKIADGVIHIDYCSMALIYLTKDHELYGLGHSENYVLLENNKVVKTPKLLMEDVKYASIGIRCIVAIKTDDSLWFWGESNNGQALKACKPIKIPTKIVEQVKQAEIFGYTTAWIDQNSNLYLCGDNSFGQIGNGTTGCGFPTMQQDIVSVPYLVLKNCASIQCGIHPDENNYSSELSVVKAITNDGKQYVWGEGYENVPTSIKTLVSVEN